MFFTTTSKLLLFLFNLFRNLFCCQNISNKKKQDLKKKSFLDHYKLMAAKWRGLNKPSCFMQIITGS